MRRRLSVFLIILLFLPLLIPLNCNHYLEVGAVLNGQRTPVTVSGKSIKSVKSPQGGKYKDVTRTEHWVNWNEPVGNPHEAFMDEQTWQRTQIGSKIDVVVASDGKAHIPGGVGYTSGDQVTDIAFMILEVLVAAGAGFALYKMYHSPGGLTGKYYAQRVR